MRSKLVSKNLGGRIMAFTVPGGLIASATASLADDHFTIRVLHDWRYGTYWIELRHYGSKRIIESIADAESVKDKASVIATIRAAVLTAEADLGIKKIVDLLREKVMAQVEAYDPPPTELQLFSQMFTRSLTSDSASESPA